ncbi:hypothetical protein H0H81_005767 [Sphagnurus paluster]|uniref:Major facilitator superfamily (MFS) profile domain-containing protein n=1 Tax=Sphagnurus paluster TaxID=117069 RepID=A0A9P7GRP2_9AGAR|nr:hypothetical protein H0H81_005767 [Sphagnurus paluster]
MAPYFIRNLIPKKDKREEARPLLTVLGELTWVQWALFFSGWLAWTCDAIDFFSVSLSVSRLQVQFNKPTHDITTAITLTLLFRTVGAIIFGVLSDRFGRKWPLVANLVLISVLQLGGGFVQTFKEFLALRSLFGIGMGGVWGLAASTALENLPVEARGLASGILQQGYAVGYLLAACINLKLVPHTKTTWRTLFWAASGISMFAAVVRAVLPESQVFLRAKELEKARGTDTSKKTKVFIQESKAMLKQHWLLCVYAVLLMTGAIDSIINWLYMLTPSFLSGFFPTPLVALRLVLSAFSLASRVHGVLNHGSHFEKHKTAFEQGAADDSERSQETSSDEKNEKHSVDV